jgi:alpha-tubulin suppressor-like RCC1 family protein
LALVVWQIGQGSTEDELRPCRVSKMGGLHIVGIAAGLWHTLCITDIGDAYAFGGNQFGQLGVGGHTAEVTLLYPKTPSSVFFQAPNFLGNPFGTCRFF